MAQAASVSAQLAPAGLPAPESAASTGRGAMTVSAIVASALTASALTEMDLGLIDIATAILVLERVRLPGRYSRPRSQSATAVPKQFSRVAAPAYSNCAAPCAEIRTS